MSEDGKKVYDKLTSGDYADVLRNIRDIEDKSEGGEAVLALAKRIVKEVFEQDPESMTGSGEEVLS